MFNDSIQRYAMPASVFRLIRRVFLVQCAAVLLACGSGGGGGETPAPLPPVPVAPTITAQPAAASATAGQTATFSVTATGTDPRYQWNKDGVAIAGATSATYTVTTVAGDNGARFSVTVSNASGTVTSAAATLTVVPPPTAPSFTRAPVTASVIAGATATFSAEAAGTAPLTYQWLRGGVAIAGATLANYSLVTALADNGAQFTVRVTNAAGSVTSNPAADLRVTAQFVPVSIVTQPQDVSVRAGQNATFSVVLGGTGPFTWRWFRDGVDTQLGVASTAINTPSFVFTPAVLSDNGARISIQITDASGTVTSRVAVLTVLP
jgi:hypothetical protein